MGGCIEKTVAFYIPHNLKIIKYAQRSLLPSPGANERCFFCLQRKEASVKWQYFG
nr:MAG TPA: vWA domain-containing protein [Caudoviricetes sp.]